jgi:hypothetical protein
VEERFEVSLKGKKQEYQRCSIQGEDEAWLIVLVSRPAPKRDSVADTRYLSNPREHRDERDIPQNHTADIKKIEFKPWQNKKWCIAGEHNGEL